MARSPVATRPKVQLITSPAVWRTMIAPARIEIIEAMRCAAPCAIAEIAELLGRPADGLYRHIRPADSCKIRIHHWSNCWNVI